jgi:tRNA A-37 threonylcarbamoyl transferase component Bud32
MVGQLTHLARSSAMVARRRAPERLGSYRLLEQIGEGGTAQVHLAVGPDDQMVAVKMLRQPGAANSVARDRLAREVAAMRRVRSPFVAEVIDADLTGEVPYIVTTLAEGSTLAEVVADHGPLSGPALKRVAYGLAAGLAAVHAAGIVHRDLKPGNVIMAGGHPVLIDFGISLQAGDAPLTETGMLLGTAGYLAPEVIEGQRARTSADVHGWGSTVGFAARGEPVYGTGPYDVVFWRVMRGEPMLDRIPRDLLPLVAAALLHEPRQRPSAAWLTLQVAGLDLTAPESSAATLSPARAISTAIRPLRPTSQHPARQMAGHQRPGEVAHVLPAIRHIQVHRAVPTGRVARPARRPRRHPLLAVALLALAVSASLVLPVVGAVTAAAAVTLLTAGYRARTGLADRRSLRGPRLWDPATVVWSFPWVLTRSAIKTVLIAPLLVAAAVDAVAGATTSSHGAQLPLAGTAVAAVYTALSCLGPWSHGARQELHRMLNAFTSSPLEMVLTILTLGVIAMIIATLALIQPSSLWPLPDPLVIHVRIPGLIPVSLHG